MFRGRLVRIDGKRIVEGPVPSATEKGGGARTRETNVDQHIDPSGFRDDLLNRSLAALKLRDVHLDLDDFGVGVGGSDFCGLLNWVRGDGSVSGINLEWAAC
jgi:hypothetical protein